MTDEPQDDDRREATALEYQDRIAAMSDRELRDVYLESSGEPGDPWIDAMVAALQEREIDI